MNITIGNVYLADLSPIFGSVQGCICPVHLLSYCETDKSVSVIPINNSKVLIGNIYRLSIDKLKKELKDFKGE